MKRLTTDKSVENMDMVELAHNCCYAKDRKAMYQDRAFDTDARSFARHVMKLQAGIELPLDDEEFDERMHDFLWYDPATSVVGTVALLYRNLWAMADLRETLKAYEDLEEQCIEENQCGLRELLLKWKAFFDDIAELYEYRKAEEQGLLLRLPCKVGDAVYIVVGKDISPQRIVEIRISSGNGTEFVTNRRTFHKSAIGETVFLTREEAEAALAEKGGALC